MVDLACKGLFAVYEYNRGIYYKFRDEAPLE